MPRGLEVRIAATASPAEIGPAPVLLRGDLAAAFRAAAEAGCAGVELHLRRADEVDARAVARLAADCGLAVPAIGTGLAAALDGLTFADPDPEVRARAVDRVRGHIELAAELEAAVIIGSISGRLGRLAEEERRSRRWKALECLARVGGLAARFGVTLMVEPLNRYECDYLNTLEQTREALRDLGASNLRLLADTFHMNIEEADIGAALRAAGRCVGHVHLADSNRQAPGHGHLDIAAVLEALADISYTGFLALEVLPAPDARRAMLDALATIRAAGFNPAGRFPTGQRAG